MESSVGALPHEPGAYLIVAPPPLKDRSLLKTLRTPLYAGHTADLRRRMSQQLRERRHLKTSFSRMVFHFTRTTSVMMARQLEQSLIMAFGPPANSRYSIKVSASSPMPAGQPRELN